MKKFLRITLWTVAGFLLVVMFLPYLLAGGLRVLWIALFGWLEFLRRVLPEVAVSWSGIGMVVICSALIVAGLHWLCAWLQRQRSGGPEARGSWRWSWSFALYAFLWLLFLTAMGITGFTHQMAWLVTSNEPWRKPRTNAGIWNADLKQAALAFNQAADDNHWNLVSTRSNFLADVWFSNPRQASLAEELQLVTIPTSNHEIELACLFYRDPAKRARTGMMVIRRAANVAYENMPYDRLPELTSKRKELWKP